MTTGVLGIPAAIRNAALGAVQRTGDTMTGILRLDDVDLYLKGNAKPILRRGGGASSLEIDSGGGRILSSAIGDLWGAGNDGAGSGLDTDLVQALDFTNDRSMGAFGWVQLPPSSGGFVMQWATITSNGSGIATVVFPAAFGTLYHVGTECVQASGASSRRMAEVYSKTPTGFTARTTNDGGVVASLTFTYLAIGQAPA